MLARALPSILLAGLLLTAPGCPGAASDGPAAGPQSLRLSFNQTTETSAPKVGERRAFTVSYGPNGEQMMSALIANESGPCLTKWHAEPANAVQFEDGGAAATFKRAGPVKIWASVVNPDGKEVTSNPIDVVVE